MRGRSTGATPEEERDALVDELEAVASDALLLQRELRAARAEAARLRTALGRCAFDAWAGGQTHCGVCMSEVGICDSRSARRELDTPGARCLGVLARAALSSPPPTKPEETP